MCATRALMCNAVGFLRVGSEVRELFSLSSGVPQGCPLSGAPWALGMDPLVRALVSSLEAAGGSEDDLGAGADD
eukprot:4459246-Pyramimonas_sp.AAC.1